MIGPSGFNVERVPPNFGILVNLGAAVMTWESSAAMAFVESAFVRAILTEICSTVGC